jgi:hypothetical protein
VAGELADLLAKVRHHGRDGVVVVGLDPHHARFLRRAKADREHRPQHDRHLAEDVPGEALADDALDPVDGLDRLDAAVEHGEDRALVALVGSIFPRHQANVRRHPRKLLSLGCVQRREGVDFADLLRGHHLRGQATAQAWFPATAAMMFNHLMTMHTATNAMEEPRC